MAATEEDSLALQEGSFGEAFKTDQLLSSSARMSSGELNRSLPEETSTAQHRMESYEFTSHASAEQSADIYEDVTLYDSPVSAHPTNIPSQRHQVNGSARIAHRAPRPRFLRPAALRRLDAHVDNPVVAGPRYLLTRVRDNSDAEESLRLSESEQLVRSRSAELDDDEFTPSTRAPSSNDSLHDDDDAFTETDGHVSFSLSYQSSTLRECWTSERSTDRESSERIVMTPLKPAGAPSRYSRAPRTFRRMPDCRF